MGNAGGLELAVNGKPAGSLGRKGQVRIVEVTANGLQPVAVQKPIGSPMNADERR